MSLSSLRIFPVAPLFCQLLCPVIGTLLFVSGLVFGFLVGMEIASFLLETEESASGTETVFWPGLMEGRLGVLGIGGRVGLGDITLLDSEVDGCRGVGEGLEGVTGLEIGFPTEEGLGVGIWGIVLIELSVLDKLAGGAGREEPEELVGILGGGEKATGGFVGWKGIGFGFGSWEGTVGWKGWGGVLPTGGFCDGGFDFCCAGIEGRGLLGGGLRKGLS